MSATRSRSRSSRSRKPYSTRLRLEPLENRRLLAVAGFTVNLYTDAGGSAGQLIAGNTIQAGQTFFAEIDAQCFDTASGGLAAVALNIAWDPRVLKEIECALRPGEIDYAEPALLRSGIARQFERQDHRSFRRRGPGSECRVPHWRTCSRAVCPAPLPGADNGKFHAFHEPRRFGHHSHAGGKPSQGPVEFSEPDDYGHRGSHRVGNAAGGGHRPKHLHNDHDTN